jgi:hypothetical protein
MTLKRLAQTAVMLVMAGAVTTGQAASIPALNVTVDGNLTDWGVILLNNNGSNLQPKTVAPGATSSLCTTPPSAVWACEDTNDNATTFAANGGLVGPEWGGQDYDVEFLGMARGTGVNANTLFVGIASGLRPDNGSNLYAPGDLFVKVNGIAYVIELGGGVGHTGGAAVGPQTQGAAGSYYNLDGSGYTISQTSLPTQTVGSIWKVADGTTTQTPWAGGPTQFLKGASQVSLGIATVYSTLDSLTGNQDQHAVIELGLDLGLFPAGIGSTTVELVWDPACFNDVLSISGTTPVPEPATMFLAGLGLIAFGYAARRRLFHR